MPRPASFAWLTLAIGSDCCSDESYVEVTMLTLSRKLLLGTGSVLALGMAGSVASSVLDAGNLRSVHGTKLIVLR